MQKFIKQKGSLNPKTETDGNTSDENNEEQLSNSEKEFKAKIKEIVSINKIILLDELDYLYTKDELVLYNLFE